MTGRVAVYAVPGIGSVDPASVRLLDRATSWFGEGAGSAAVATHDASDAYGRAFIDSITVQARRYGFHATIKAPFRLADGCTIVDLEEEVTRFASARHPVIVPSLVLAGIGHFFALTAARPSEEMNDLAADAVMELDGFRAPATAAEVSRRRPDTLTEQQRERLTRWGYPYVLDQFRFHLTLTDPVPDELRPAVHDRVSRWFGDCLDEPITIDALCLFTESEPGAPFLLHSIHRLGSGPQPDSTITAARREGVR